MKTLLLTLATVITLSSAAHAGCDYRLNELGRLDSVSCPQKDGQQKAQVVRVNADLDGRVKEILPAAAPSAEFSVVSFCINTDAKGKVLSETSCAL